MNILGAGSRILRRSNPILLMATGAALALSIPPVKRGLWETAVFATRGLMKVKEGVQSISSRLKEGVEDIVAEAKNNRENSRSTCEVIESLSDSIRDHGRAIAVTATAGALAVKDKAVELGNEFKDILSEAKETESELKESERNHNEPVEQHEFTLGE